MLGHQFAYSAAPIRRVKEVQFGILSPEEIVRRVPFYIGCRLTHPIFTLYRKLIPLPKLNIQKLWMRPPTSPS
jgi:hypothetical protein